MEVALSPVKGEDGSYKLGAWVRDDTQGIGTITYVDPTDISEPGPWDKRQ